MASYKDRLVAARLDQCSKYIAKSLGGIVICMKCREPFHSPDKRRVRRCSTCKNQNTAGIREVSGKALS